MSEAIPHPICWAHMMRLLSLDLTAAFTRLLRIDGFYSEELKQMARMTLPPLDEDEPVEAWHAESFLRSEPFVESVIQRFGRETFDKIRAWMDARYISYAGGDAMTIYYVLEDLVRYWDGDDHSQQSLPLMDPADAEIRIMIRDHISHHEAVEKEAQRTAQMIDSEWDASMDERMDIEEWSITDVTDTILYWDNGSLWERVARLISAEKASELLRWMEMWATSPDNLLHVRREQWRPPRLLVMLAGQK